jgi:hypothetical protein
MTEKDYRDLSTKWITTVKNIVNEDRIDELKSTNPIESILYAPMCPDQDEIDHIKYFLFSLTQHNREDTEFLLGEDINKFDEAIGEIEEWLKN